MNDRLMKCCNCGVQPHRFCPSPEAATGWYCSDCGEMATPSYSVRGSVIIPKGPQLMALRRVLLRHGIIHDLWQCPLKPRSLGKIVGLDADQIDTFLSLLARLN